MSVETRPPVSTTADHQRWRQPDDPGPRKFGDNNVSKDSRLTTIINWIMGVSSIVIAAASIAAVSRFFDIGDSQVRMEGKIDLSNEVQSIQFSQMDRRMSAVENRVGAIEQRQIDAQNLRARP